MLEFITVFAGYTEKLEIKTSEVSNFLDMMRNASTDKNGGYSTSINNLKAWYLVLIAFF